MSGIHHATAHVHHSPPHVKKTNTSKAARPGTSSKSAPTPKITIKAAKAAKKAKEEAEEVFEDDDDSMASSFLQFCAMCEKQIVVPNSSILYCSESCRRRDAASPTTEFDLLTLRSPNTKLPPPSYDEIDPFDAKLPTYVPALQPTPRTLPDGRIPAKYHDGKADIDPTEWKPADPTTGAGVVQGREKPITKSLGEWKPKLSHRPSSEAASYLSKFHHKSSDSLSSKRSGGTRPTTTPATATAATFSSRSTPGLSHTPTASTSSEESLSLAGTPYEFVTRPAFSMPAATTTASTTAAAAAGSAVTATGSKNGGITYEKKHVRTSLGSAASGSLKKLLGGNAVSPVAATGAGEM
ncbi:hypothetical protein ACLMJK_005055 [Lecanora helva]